VAPHHVRSMATCCAVLVYDMYVPLAERSASAKERAYEHAKQLVLSSPAASGAFLGEEEVASALGISRTPVREAFLRLAAEQLIELLPRRGAFIPPVSSHEVVDVMEARRAIEPFALAQCSDLGGLAALLATALEEQTSLRDDARRFIERDRGFHLAIVQASGNRVLESFYDSLRDRMTRMGVVAVHQRRDRTQHVLDEHLEIVTRLCAGDREGAVGALDAHLISTLQALSRERP
jgi:DNA-binding GntR family transcriptional regulator